ncbi:MAG: hypothetical protein A2100_04420 [Sideroxydans sp. GWF2_59_14]|nr:MAG: hypothetical protein A2100_04420 [Sideroxydans sp. GWF2_59_14]HAF43672.1 hypothetical protein [Gallionellaceae bacterium]
MRKLLFASCLFSFSIPAMASCDSLKAQIDTKLQAKGIPSYTLEVVPIAQAAPAPASGVAAATQAGETTGKVVGTCEGNTKQILYTRN